MKLLRVSLGTFALAASLLTAGDALAAVAATCTTSGGTVVSITDPGSCHFETGPTCTQQCTPENYTTTCSTQCTDTATKTCTNDCETTCNTACTTKPATFTCKDECTSNCQAGCMAGCSGGDCSADCSASCDAQCTESCKEHPGSTDCTTECQDCCGGSCTVQANVSCNQTCVSQLSGGCTTKCDGPNGGLFCDGQYIDIDTIDDCTFSLGFATTTTGSLSTTCSAAPGRDSRSGLPAALGALAGIGLFVSRRRRRA